MAGKVLTARAEPFAITVRAATRTPEGERIRNSPNQGDVLIEVTSGPTKGKGVQLHFKAADQFARGLRDPKRALEYADVNCAVRVFHLPSGVRVERLVADTRFEHWWALYKQPGIDKKLADAKLASALDRIANAITIAARQAEQDQDEVAKQVARDHATAARGGFPLGFTNDPEILREAQKIHDFDPQLRKYAQTSRLTTSIEMPLPTVVQSAPKAPGEAFGDATKNLTPQERRALLRQLEQQAEEP